MATGRGKSQKENPEEEVEASKVETHKKKLQAFKGIMYGLRVS
ncbi:hypothetical protein M5D96_003781 [Drosophila gunungcola]|uniref:Uncharacterized protein n=1 Tax=Drosophila gunungcola TaxID=103775 RepID=A0A9P9YSU0_9MUSC|nr:hypothetical protein M5D96_003781 [Drosophila gunungcola]